MFYLSSRVKFLNINLPRSNNQICYVIVFRINKKDALGYQNMFNIIKKRETVLLRRSVKKYSSKFLKIHRKTPGSELACCKPATFLMKETLSQLFFLCILRNTLFIQKLQKAASSLYEINTSSYSEVFGK